VTVVLAILAAVLLLRAAFLATMTLRYRARGGVFVTSVHAGVLALAGALATAAAFRTDVTLYLVLACGIVMGADLVIVRLLLRRDAATNQAHS